MTWEIFIASPHHASHLDHNRFKNIKRIQIFLIRYCYWQEKSRFCLRKLSLCHRDAIPKNNLYLEHNDPDTLFFERGKTRSREYFTRTVSLSLFIYLFIYLSSFSVLFSLVDRRLYTLENALEQKRNCTDQLCTRERFAFHSGIIISLRSVMIPFAQ